MKQTVTRFLLSSFLLATLLPVNRPVLADELFELNVTEQSNGVELSFTQPQISLGTISSYDIYRRDFPSQNDMVVLPERFQNDTEAKQVLMGSEMVPLMNFGITAGDGYSHLEKVELTATGQIGVIQSLSLFYGDYQLGEAQAVEGGTISWFLEGVDQIYMPRKSQTTLTVYGNFHKPSQKIALTNTPLQLTVTDVQARTNVDLITLSPGGSDRTSEKIYPVMNTLAVQIHPDTALGDKAAPFPNETLFAFKMSAQSAQGGNTEARVKKIRMNITGNAVLSNFELHNLNTGSKIDGVVTNVDCHPGSGLTSVIFDLTGATDTRDFELSDSEVSYALKARVFSKGANGETKSSLSFSIANLGNGNSDNFDLFNSTSSDFFWEDADLAVNNDVSRFWVDQETNSISSGVSYLSEVDTGVDSVCKSLAQSSFVVHSALVASENGTNNTFSKIASISPDESVYLDTEVANGRVYQYFVIGTESSSRKEWVRSTLETITPRAVVSGGTTEEPPVEEPPVDEEPSEEPPVEPPVEETTNVELPFTDVSATAWFRGYIVDLFERKILNGYADSTFRPNQPVSRAEFLKMSFLMQGMDLEQSSDLDFSDVRRIHWFYEYVAMAKAGGIVEGYADGTFRPDQSVTRAEALKILFGIYNANTQYSNSGGFQDIASHWAKAYILSALEKGLIENKAFFEPDRPISRAEAAKLIVEMHNYMSIGM